MELEHDTKEILKRAPEQVRLLKKDDKLTETIPESGFSVANFSASPERSVVLQH